MTLQIPRRLITVAEYHKMAEVGILSAEDHVELLNGEIIQMSPIKSKHAGHVNRIDAFLKQQLGNQAIVAVQNPVQLSDFSEPEPDIAILKYQPDFYTTKHPQVEDVIVLIEVSLSTEDLDRQVKLPLYAAAGIAEYWIVNLNKNHLEVYREPNIKQKTYLDKKIYTKKDQVLLKQFELDIPITSLIF